ncbi:MAG: LOG family protein [Pirellulaceae bacterium]|nr:LOG family protein [Pirellulaceae bacterium]
MFHTYRAPQTEDGWIVDVSRGQAGDLLIRATFQIPDDLDPDTIASHGRFASRSRIARLGIDIRPLGVVEVQDRTASLTASVRAVVPQYKIEEQLFEVFVPNLPVGRLVVCDPGVCLSSERIFADYSANAFKLPQGFSIDSMGRFTIHPHKLVYELDRTPSVEELQTILTRPDGKALLNRLQIPHVVDNILMGPGQGVITSCTMFLHRHFAVLESEQSPLGRHMHAVVLDPVTTRGPRVFLEFFNDSPTPIVNPTATGFIYAANKLRVKSSTWQGMINGKAHIETRSAAADYAHLSALFSTAELTEGRSSYLERAVAVVREPLESFDPAEPLRWHRPVLGESAGTLPRIGLPRVVNPTSGISAFGTRMLEELPAQERATVLIQHFPNLSEHLDLISAAQKGKIERIIFQKASFEHGPFLSSRDHARLADYADLGVDVLWCNDVRRHLAVHVFRGHRGFFCELDAVDNFKQALVIAVYGSSRELPPVEARRLRRLVKALHDFFGDDLAIMTGGGPGAMQQASTFARDHGLLVGASYLEIEDQQTNQLAEFYQVFQENCRHSRQRWFEIAGFHIFCIGGVGTLEEIGVTLTDIKLGLADGTPLIFFGHRENGLYWQPLVTQLQQIAESGRGPEWLRTHVLVTDEPDAVIAFYKEKLDLG